MAKVFHPWVGEALLLALRSRRRLIVGLAWRAGGVALIAALSVWMAHELGYSLDRASAAVLAGLRRWSSAIAILAAFFGYALAHRTVLDLRTYLAQGWWAATPAPAHALAATCAAAAVVRLAVPVAAAVLVALLLGAVAGDPSQATGLALSIAAAAGVGCACGLTVACYRRPRSRAARRERTVAPLWRTRALDGMRLGALSAWQRREATSQWRKGGKFWVMGVVAAGIPGGAPIVPIFGFVMLSASMVWFSGSLQASVEVAERARHLLAAVPMPAAERTRALARYPLLAASLGLVACSVGVFLLGATWIGWLSALLILAILSVRTLCAAWRIWRGRTV